MTANDRSPGHGEGTSGDRRLCKETVCGTAPHLAQSQSTSRVLVMQSHVGGMMTEWTGSRPSLFFKVESLARETQLCLTGLPVSPI